MVNVAGEVFVSVSLQLGDMESSTSKHILLRRTLIARPTYLEEETNPPHLTKTQAYWHFSSLREGKNQSINIHGFFHSYDFKIKNAKQLCERLSTAGRHLSTTSSGGH